MEKRKTNLNGEAFDPVATTSPDGSMPSSLGGAKKSSLPIPARRLCPLPFRLVVVVVAEPDFFRLKIVASPPKPFNLCPVLDCGAFPLLMCKGEGGTDGETARVFGSGGDGGTVGEDIVPALSSLVAAECDRARGLTENDSPIERDFRILFAGTGGGMSSSSTLISWSYWSKRASSALK